MEEAVAESRVLHDQSQDRHEHICLDREHIIKKAGLLEAFLPFAELLAVSFRDAEGFASCANRTEDRGIFKAKRTATSV